MRSGEEQQQQEHLVVKDRPRDGNSAWKVAAAEGVVAV
jgi:hypothetical protein